MADKIYFLIIFVAPELKVKILMMIIEAMVYYLFVACGQSFFFLPTGGKLEIPTMKMLLSKSD